jgi:hypothetical protein
VVYRCIGVVPERELYLIQNMTQNYYYLGTLLPEFYLRTKVLVTNLKELLSLVIEDIACVQKS